MQFILQGIALLLYEEIIMAIKIDFDCNHKLYIQRSYQLN